MATINLRQHSSTSFCFIFIGRRPDSIVISSFWLSSEMMERFFFEPAIVHFVGSHTKSIDLNAANKLE